MPCGGLAVFPLFASGSKTMPYILAADALAAGSVVISEICEAGPIGSLVVDNGGDHPVLFVEGEEIVGAKQNRLVSRSVLVEARTYSHIIPIILQRTTPLAECTPAMQGGVLLPADHEALREKTELVSCKSGGRKQPRATCHLGGHPPAASGFWRPHTNEQSVRSAGHAPCQD